MARAALLIVFGVGFIGCTRHNAAFEGATVDLASGPQVGRDLSVADLKGSVSDGATGDLARLADLSSTIDLAGVDLAICGNLSQACCANRGCHGTLQCTPGGNTCSDCGGPGQPCCSGQCAAGGCCSANVCMPSGKSCGTHLVCLAGNCAACGGDGQSCCANNACIGGDPGAASCCDTTNHKCVPSLPSLGAACGGGVAGMCSNGSCGGCGNVSQACCALPGATTMLSTNVCSASNTVCTMSGMSGLCQTCGAENQPCCGVSSCGDGGCCVAGMCRKNGTSCGMGADNCSAGSCGNGTCGGVGQACCGGNAGFCSAADTRCIEGLCNPCGGKDERCCVDPAKQTNSFCEQPYKPMVDPTNICFCRA